MTFVESDVVELKREFSVTICKDIVSFLNADGGTIYLGITDKGNIVGVSNVDETFKKIANVIADQIEPNPQDIITTELKSIDNKTIIAINIQKGVDPIYCQKKLGFSTAGCSIRIGTTSREMTQEQIKIRYEKRFFASELLVETPTRYGMISFNSLKIYYSSKNFHLNEETFETNLFLKTKTVKYNKLAELMSDNNTIPLIFAKFKGVDKASISQRSDYGNQCLLVGYEEILRRIVSENICITDTTKRPRVDTFLFNFNAANEAIANALVHNDWNITEPSISFFNDRLEILSHGGLPQNQTENDFFEGISKPRNQKLMRIFLDLGFVEHTGHGIPTILSVYGKDAFQITDRYIKVTIPFNKLVVESSNINKDIASSYYLDLNQTERTIISLLLNDPSYTILSIAENLKLTTRTIERSLKSLQEKKIIDRIGSKKTGIWKVLK